MGNNGLNMDQIRRAVGDVIADLHARRLAIPAGVMLVAIIAAVFVLPKSSSPPPPQPVTTPVADGEAIERPAQVSLKLVGVSSLEDDVALTDSSNPFYGTDAAKCSQINSGEPKKFSCMIGDLLVRVTCPPAGPEVEAAGICATKSSGASGSTGASAETGAPMGTETPSSGGDTGGGNGGGQSEPQQNPTETESFYVIQATIDDTTFSNVEAGAPLPDTKTILVTYAGTNSKNTKAIFIAGDGVSVAGVPVDESLGTFELEKGKSATLTDPSGVTHSLKLDKISKVTK